MKKIKNSALFKYILGLAVILRFWNLMNGDMLSDATLYSYRALGWFDYLGGGQTTPIQWFGVRPGWSYLSFHDHPLMVFFIQHLFYSVLGPTILASRLPFALAGIGSAVVIYYLVKEKKESTALWAFFIFSISSFAIWISRTGYLEGIQIIFICLSVYFFVRYLQRNLSKDLYLWAFFTGCAYMSKYSAIFLLPSAFLYLVIWKRELFKNKQFWIAAGVFIVTLFPIIIYNAMMFKTRGHFDWATSSMLGIRPADFVGLTKTTNIHLIANFRALSGQLIDNMSWPFLVISVTSFLYSVFNFIKKKTDAIDKFVLFNISFLFILLLFMGGERHWASIILPFMVIQMAIFISDLSLYLKNKKIFLYRLFLAVIVFSFVWELSYAINTNIAPRQFGRANINYSNGSIFVKNNGWNQLDEYLKNDVIKTLPPMKKIVKIDDMGYTQSDLQGKEIIFYDDMLSWFEYSWYLQPYMLFYKYPVFPVSQATSLVKSGDPILNLNIYGATGVYFIKSLSDIVRDSTKLQNQELRKNMEEMAKLFEKDGATVKEIRNINGDLNFKVYHIKY